MPSSFPEIGERPEDVRAAAGYRLNDEQTARAASYAVVEQVTAGQVLSELAREALTGRQTGPRAVSAFHGFEPFPHRGVAVSNALIDQLREDEAT